MKIFERLFGNGLTEWNLKSTVTFQITFAHNSLQIGTPKRTWSRVDNTFASRDKNLTVVKFWVLTCCRTQKICCYRIRHHLSNDRHVHLRNHHLLLLRSYHQYHRVHLHRLRRILRNCWGWSHRCCNYWIRRNWSYRVLRHHRCILLRRYCVLRHHHRILHHLLRVLHLHHHHILHHHLHVLRHHRQK